MAARAAAAASPALLILRLARAVIDFLEELVVLAYLSVVRLELERLLVRLARFVELPLMLVGDREVVVRRGIGRIDLNCFLPTVNGLAPQPLLCDIDAERHLRARLAARVSKSGRRKSRDQCNERRDEHLHDGIVFTIRVA